MNVILTLPIFAFAFILQQPDYDPSQTFGEVTVEEAEFEYGDDHRKVHLRVYLPDSESKAPVILFSHGLGGSRDNNPYLGNHWAGRGFIVIFMQHAGSDENVWKDVNRRDRMKKLKAAANKKSLDGRIGDVTATLDKLQTWNAEGEKFAGRLDLKKVGMSGHSFGAVTTQAVSGQKYGRRGAAYTDSRITAAIAMSPSPPLFGNDDETFGNVKIPWMLMTGTQDKSIVSSATPSDRLKVFQQLPPQGHFYQLVLEGAQHMAFSQRRLSGGPQRNINHHKAILAMSSAFWDAYLKDDEAAKKWLDGESAKAILEPNDLFQRK